MEILCLAKNFWTCAKNKPDHEHDVASYVTFTDLNLVSCTKERQFLIILLVNILAFRLTDYWLLLLDCNWLLKKGQILCVKYVLMGHNIDLITHIDYCHKFCQGNSWLLKLCCKWKPFTFILANIVIWLCTIHIPLSC